MQQTRTCPKDGTGSRKRRVCQPGLGAQDSGPLRRIFLSAYDDRAQPEYSRRTAAGRGQEVPSRWTSHARSPQRFGEGTGLHHGGTITGGNAQWCVVLR